MLQAAVAVALVVVAAHDRAQQTVCSLLSSLIICAEIVHRCEMRFALRGIEVLDGDRRALALGVNHIVADKLLDKVSLIQ